jgi:2-aminoethylphosphonate-pyruvate transaminase
MVTILKRTKRDFVSLEYPDSEIVKPNDVIEKLRADTSITHVAMIHSETTSGVINPIDFMAGFTDRRVVFIVDAMSSFGAYDIHQHDLGIDFLVSSANKCIQGCPGFAFAIAKKDVLGKCKGNATSLVLDLYD